MAAPSHDVLGNARISTIAYIRYHLWQRTVEASHCRKCFKPQIVRPVWLAQCIVLKLYPAIDSSEQVGGGLLAMYCKEI